VSADTLRARLAAVRLAAFDVDGVFTDGRIYVADDGTESKAFSTLDGYGVRRLLEGGIEVAVISGRQSAAVEKRMAELGVRHVLLACADKVAAFERLAAQLSLTPAQCCYTGDDLPDLALLQQVGVSIAVANAHREIRAVCDYTTGGRGGFGAVREVCDLLLDARR